MKFIFDRKMSEVKAFEMNPALHFTSINVKCVQREKQNETEKQLKISHHIEKQMLA
jgi:hypothetical protein